jgi:hypothetical protein
MSGRCRLRRDHEQARPVPSEAGPASSKLVGDKTVNVDVDVDVDKKRDDEQDSGSEAGHR